MIDRPTPETDAFSVKFKSLCGNKEWVPVDFSRRLEMERDELRSIVEQRLLAGATIHQNANDMMRLNEKLEHELDEARNFSDKQAAKYAESKSNVRLLVKQLVLQIERPAYTVDEAVDKMFLMESAKKFINEVQ